MDQSLISFAGGKSYDQEVMDAMKTLEAFKTNSHCQLLEQVKKTEQTSLQIVQNQSLFSAETEALENRLVMLKIQYENLILENSHQKQLIVAERTEKGAWKNRAETAERLLAEQSQIAAMNEQKLRLQLEEAIKEKGEAVQLTAKIAEEQKAAINKQMQILKEEILNLSKGVNIGGHFFEPARLVYFRGQGCPYCSCHSASDRNGYSESVHWKYRTTREGSDRSLAATYTTAAFAQDGANLSIALEDLLKKLNRLGS